MQQSTAIPALSRLWNRANMPYGEISSTFFPAEPNSRCVLICLMTKSNGWDCLKWKRSAVRRIWSFTVLTAPTRLCLIKTPLRHSAQNIVRLLALRGLKTNYMKAFRKEKNISAWKTGCRFFMTTACQRCLTICQVPTFFWALMPTMPWRQKKRRLPTTMKHGLKLWKFVKFPILTSTAPYRRNFCSLTHKILPRKFTAGGMSYFQNVLCRKATMLQIMEQLRKKYSPH